MDWTLFHAVNDLAGQVDQIDDFLEFAARSLPLLFIPLLMAMWFWPGSRAERDSRQWACTLATASASLALVLNQIIIRLWDRPRPFTDHDVKLLLAPSADPSFPSDHATFAFAIAVAIFLVNRRIGIIALLIAVVIGFARVYVGEHYVSEVVAGAVIGGLIALITHQTRSLLQPILEPLLRLTRRFHLG